MAKVVCHQLGLPRDNAQALIGAQFGDGYGPVWLGHVECSGLESNLGECKHQGFGIHHCSAHYDDISIRCTRGA